MTGSNKKHHYMICISFYIFHLLILAHVFFSCSPHCFARDTLNHEDRILDDGETLVSPGEIFELGFFTPSGSSRGDKRRYVGIWYRNLTSQTVVWVANRGKPLTNFDGVLAIKDGNLEVLDMAGNHYWSTLLERSASSNLTVKLIDSGNLVLYNNTELGDQYLWQSFEHPTDTFLPQMKMDKNLYLIAWKSENNPEEGGFTFKVDEEDEKQFILTKKSSKYWRSREPGEMRDEGVTYLLSNFSTEVKPTTSTYPRINTTFYNDTRLVINYTGQIQFLKLDKEGKTWSLQWLEPRDGCSVFNACGDFGVCNIETTKPCKCLPGFEPRFPQRWDSGVYLEGCTRKTKLCGEDSFLRLKMMKAGLESLLLVNKNETECRKECLENCRCLAYSIEEAQNSSRRGDTRVSGPSCRIWEELTSLQEYENGGRNISVRVALSDLEPNARTCQPCGTTMIPYPLSTGPDCGDPLYFRFLCNTSSTGWVSFEVSGLVYRVISMDPEKRRFVIDTNIVDNCNSRGTVVMLGDFSPFKVANSCYAEPEPEMVAYTSQVPSLGRTVKVEISWELPKLEPTCTSSANCKEWPHTTCMAAKEGGGRCLCGANFRWNGNTLNCTQEGVIDKPAAEPSRESRQERQLSIWIILPTVILGIILLASVVSFTIWRRKKTRKQENRKADKRNRTLHTLDSQRRVKDLIDSGDLMSEDDQKGIDVPFFNLESILEATDDFSDLNKLGQGGYGPVYKGKFPGGEDIAVKRLSTLSGQGLQEFKNEVVLIAKLQHRNLVRLRGFCIKGDEKILLYEYMPNRSLDSFIFDQTRSVLLNWETRFNIIMGIARGLLYLHQDSRLRIIHRDLKTSNILLDEEMNAKISDFGLARIFGGKQTEANTSRVVGTYGYMSPEYALDGSFSIKSDVYSFGVVLLEIISGKKNTGFYQSERRFSLLGFAWSLWTGEKVLELMDEALHESCKEDQFVKCVNVALLCVQDDPSDRPAMSNVVTMLDSESASLPTPKEPAFVTRRGFSSTASSSLPETNTEITLTLQEDRLV